jgi:hypothetical protein
MQQQCFQGIVRLSPGHQYLKGLQKCRPFSLSTIQLEFLQFLVTSHFFENFQFFLEAFLQNYWQPMRRARTNVKNKTTQIQ